jgi:hypothetical protein
MMSEEMKLLMALCDAMGFTVETEYDYDERKVSGTVASRINSGIDYPDFRGLALRTGTGAMGVAILEKDDQGMYTSYRTTPRTSYKLTKISLASKHKVNDTLTVL